VVEIIPPDGTYFDYESKYNGQTQEICPARFDDVLTQEIQKIALEAYHTVGCSRYGRIDIMIGEDGPVLLAINTIP
jgi:D-alanine-D-alanine ligase